MEGAIIGAAAAVVALLGGVVLGAWLERRKFRAHYAEVGGEITRLRNIAESKMSGDDPNLETLLRELNDTVENAVKTAEALEKQGQIIRRKTEGGKEIIAASRYVARMIEDFNGGISEPLELTPQEKAPRKDAPAEQNGAAKKRVPQLR